MLSEEALASRLGTDLSNGLTTDEATRRLQEGPNILTFKLASIETEELISPSQYNSTGVKLEQPHTYIYRYEKTRVYVRRDGYRQGLPSPELVVG